jgi:hypothetical protein
MQFALGVTGLDELQGAPVEREDEVALGLHLGLAPGKLPGLRIPVRSGGPGELALPGAAEIRELEKVPQVGGEMLVNRREGGGVEVPTPRALLGEDAVGEVEPGRIEPELTEPVRPAEELCPPVAGAGAHASMVSGGEAAE